MKFPRFSPDRLVARSGVYFGLGMIAGQMARWSDGLHWLFLPGMTAVWVGFTAVAFHTWRKTPAIWAVAIAWGVLYALLAALSLGGILASFVDEWPMSCLALAVTLWLNYEQFRFLFVVVRENRALPSSAYRGPAKTSP